MIPIFKIVSFLEGVSYILLLFIATPIKYLQGNDTYVKMLGMPHGVFFIAYVLLSISLKYKLNWNNRVFSIVCLLSLIPFGTFFVNKYVK